MDTLTAPVVVSPEPIVQAAWSFAVTRVLTTAVDLDLFTAIARGHRTLEALVKDRACSPRGLATLLHALTSLGYVEATHDGYRLPPMSVAFLSQASPSYMGAYLQHQVQESWGTWSQLTEVVRSGEPARQSVHGDAADAAFFSGLVASLHVINAPAASVAARVLDERRAHQLGVVLDVGAGSGVWSLALARQHPETRATVLDLPDVIDTVTRPFVTREGCADRFAFRPGDFTSTDFGESAFDVIVLGHICHGEGAEGTQALLRRAFRALRPGGHILIAEFVPDDDRDGPPLPLLFALHMLVVTDRGGTYTLAEFSDRLTAAGFVDIATIPAPAPSPLIVASRP